MTPCGHSAWATLWSTGVEEHTLPVSLTFLTGDEALIARRVDPLPSGFLDRATMNFQFSNHSWVIRVDGLTVLVDPCTGNGRTGRGPCFDGLDVPYLDRLAAGVCRPSRSTSSSARTSTTTTAAGTPG